MIILVVMDRITRSSTTDVVVLLFMLSHVQFRNIFLIIPVLLRLRLRRANVTSTASLQAKLEP